MHPLDGPKLQVQVKISFTKGEKFSFQKKEGKIKVSKLVYPEWHFVNCYYRYYLDLHYAYMQLQFSNLI